MERSPQGNVVRPLGACAGDYPVQGGGSVLAGGSGTAQSMPSCMLLAGAGTRVGVEGSAGGGGGSACAFR